MDASGFGVIASYAGGVSTILVGVTLIWIAIRTKSWHPIRYRLWLFVNGKSKVADEAVAKTLQDEADLTAFRFFSMDADSLYEARSLIAWGESRRVSMSMLRACGEYFLRKELALKDKLPKLKPPAVVVGFVSVVGLWVMVIAVFGILTSSAVLKFNNNGQWLLLGPHAARPLFAVNPTPVTDATCKASKGSPISSFSAEQGKIFCPIFADPKIEAYVADTVRQQRMALTFFIGVSLLFLGQLWGALFRLRSAWYLKRHLEETALS